MTRTEARRPVERRVLHWAQEGLDDAEIGRRFGRTPRWVSQVRFLAGLDREGAPSAPAGPAERLRPLERRLLRWREEGASHEDLSARFRRSPEFLGRVEHYARYKLAT